MSTDIVERLNVAASQAIADASWDTQCGHDPDAGKLERDAADAITRLRAENAELAKDRERLDWIATCVAEKMVRADAWLWCNVGGPSRTPETYDLRAAIDAARGDHAE